MRLKELFDHLVFLRSPFTPIDARVNYVDPTIPTLLRNVIGARHVFRNLTEVGGA